MFARLSALRLELAALAAAIDPALLQAADAARVVEQASTIERLAATIKALAPMAGGPAALGG